MSATTRNFFATALAALAGAALLHLSVLAGQWSSWAAMVHLTMFGWVTAMIFAVSYHTMPVFSGRDFPYPALVRAHLVAFAVGVTVATISYLMNWGEWVLVGLLLQVGSALIFVANTVLLFVRGPRQPHPPPLTALPGQAELDRIGTASTKRAAIWLVLALALIALVQARWLPGTWLLAGEHLAALGWIMGMIMGVAYHVLPRFSNRVARGARWALIQQRCHLLSILLMAPGLGFDWRGMFAAGALFMTVSLALFAWIIWPTLVPLRMLILPTIAPPGRQA